MQYIINDRYFIQKRKQMKTVYIEGTDGLTDKVKWILNNYTSYNKALLKQIILRGFNHNF